MASKLVDKAVASLVYTPKYKIPLVQAWPTQHKYVFVFCSKQLS